MHRHNELIWSANAMLKCVSICIDVINTFTRDEAEDRSNVAEKVAALDSDDVPK